MEIILHVDTIEVKEEVDMGTKERPRRLKVSVFYEKKFWGKTSVEDLIHDFMDTVRMAYSER